MFWDYSFLFFRIYFNFGMPLVSAACFFVFYQLVFFFLTSSPLSPSSWYLQPDFSSSVFLPFCTLDLGYFFTLFMADPQPPVTSCVYWADTLFSLTFLIVILFVPFSYSSATLPFFLGYSTFTSSCCLCFHLLWRMEPWQRFLPVWFSSWWRDCLSSFSLFFFFFSCTRRESSVLKAFSSSLHINEGTKKEYNCKIQKNISHTCSNRDSLWFSVPFWKVAFSPGAFSNHYLFWKLSHFTLTIFFFNSWLLFNITLTESAFIIFANMPRSSLKDFTWSSSSPTPHTSSVVVFLSRIERRSFSYLTKFLFLSGHQTKPNTNTHATHTYTHTISMNKKKIGYEIYPGNIKWGSVIREGFSGEIVWSLQWDRTKHEKVIKWIFWVEEIVGERSLGLK